MREHQTRSTPCSSHQTHHQRHNLSLLGFRLGISCDTIMERLQSGVAGCQLQKSTTNRSGKPVTCMLKGRTYMWTQVSESDKPFVKQESAQLVQRCRCRCSFRHTVSILCQRTRTTKIKWYSPPSITSTNRGISLFEISHLR